MEENDDGVNEPTAMKAYASPSSGMEQNSTGSKGCEVVEALTFPTPVKVLSQ